MRAAWVVIPVSPRPMPPPTPIASRKRGSVGAALPISMPPATMASPRQSSRRGFQCATRYGLSSAPPILSSDAVADVAAREPPKSASRAGRNTGKVLVIPATSSIVAKASQSRWLARDSRGGVTREWEGPGREAREGSVVRLGPLHGLAPLLARLGLLPLAFDRRLLVVRALLHLLEEPILQHELLHGLERGLDLIVVHLDTHDRHGNRRPGCCQCLNLGAAVRGVRLRAGVVCQT